MNPPSSVSLLVGHVWCLNKSWTVGQSVVTHLSPLCSVLSGSDGLVKLWTIKTNECVKTLDAHQDKVWGLHGTHKDDKMVTGSADSNITVWVVSVIWLMVAWRTEGAARGLSYRGFPVMPVVLIFCLSILGNKWHNKLLALKELDCKFVLENLLGLLFNSSKMSIFQKRCSKITWRCTQCLFGQYLQVSNLLKCPLAKYSVHISSSWFTLIDLSLSLVVGEKRRGFPPCGHQQIITKNCCLVHC